MRWIIVMILIGIKWELSASATLLFPLAMDEYQESPKGDLLWGLGLLGLGQLINYPLISKELGKWHLLIRSRGKI